MQQWSVKTVSLTEDAPLWDRLHASSNRATVFSSSGWLRLLGEVFERPATASLLLSGDDPVAGIPLLTAQRGPLRVSPPLPITLYAGWLADERRVTVPSSGLHDLLDHIERHCHYASLGLPPKEALADLLRTRRWTLHRMQTRRIAIADADALWRGYSQSLRRKLRRAHESDLHLDHDPPSALMADCYELSYQRHGISPPIPKERVRGWIEALKRNGLVATYAARRLDGRCAAVRAVTRDGDMLYDWLAGADPAVAPSASHWLVHEILTHYHEQGCRHFDFMGANTPGVADFKRSFGGELVPYVDAEWYRPAFLKTINRIRSRSIRRQRGIQ